MVVFLIEVLPVVTLHSLTIVAYDKSAQYFILLLHGFKFTGQVLSWHGWNSFRQLGEDPCVGISAPNEVFSGVIWSRRVASRQDTECSRVTSCRGAVCCDHAQLLFVDPLYVHMPSCPYVFPMHAVVWPEHAEVPMQLVDSNIFCRGMACQ